MACDAFIISWGDTRSARKREEVEDMFFEQVCCFFFFSCFHFESDFTDQWYQFLSLSLSRSHCLREILGDVNYSSSSSSFLSTDLISACKSARERADNEKVPFLLARHWRARRSAPCHSSNNWLNFLITRWLERREDRYQSSNGC